MCFDAGGIGPRRHLQGLANVRPMEAEPDQETEQRRRPSSTRRRALPLAVLALVVLAAAGIYALADPFSDDDQSAVAGEGLASIVRDCSKAVDGEINDFLASVPNGATVKFPKGGCYRQHDSIWMRDRKDIVVDGNGSTFAFDTTTDAKKNYRSNWRIWRGSGITLKNMTIRGACKPKQCRNGSLPPPKDGYGQHGINLESTADPVIDRVHVRDALSDGISAEGTLNPRCCWRGPATSNLVLKNSHVERAGRMLIGITDLDGGLIEGNRIENNPMAGIDIEVDTPGFKGRRIRIVDNTFDNIHAQIIANGGLGSDPDVAEITIEGNSMVSRSKACAGGIFLRSPGPKPKSYRTGYVVRNNKLKLIGAMVQAERIKDLTIEGNTTDHKAVGCGEKGAVELLDSHGVDIKANDFSGYPKEVYADPAATGVSVAPRSGG